MFWFIFFGFNFYGELKFFFSVYLFCECFRFLFLKLEYKFCYGWFFFVDELGNDICFVIGSGVC